MPCGEHCPGCGQCAEGAKQSAAPFGVALRQGPRLIVIFSLCTFFSIVKLLLLLVESSNTHIDISMQTTRGGGGKLYPLLRKLRPLRNIIHTYTLLIVHQSLRSSLQVSATQRSL